MNQNGVNMEAGRRVQAVKTSEASGAGCTSIVCLALTCPRCSLEHEPLLPQAPSNSYQATLLRMYRFSEHVSACYHNARIIISGIRHGIDVCHNI